MLIFEQQKMFNKLQFEMSDLDQTKELYNTSTMIMEDIKEDQEDYPQQYSKHNISKKSNKDIHMVPQ